MSVKRSTFLLILIISAVSITLAAVASSDRGTAAVCGPTDKPCSKSEDCCSGCCNNNKCSDCSNHSPCNYHHCPQGKECYLHQVTCIAAPCNPIPACKTKDSDYDEDYDKILS